MDLGIAGKRAAIGGASSGLGLACARALCEAGVEVAICGRDDARLAAALETLPGRAVAVRADLSTPEEGARFVREARDVLGGLDIVIPNAGGPPPGNFAATPYERYPEALALNLLSVVAMCQEAVPGLRAQGWGRVVAITSTSVRQPLPNLILSNTARAGTTGFLKTLALEVAADGVTVNSVQPGMHRTARVEQLVPDVEALAAAIPSRKLGTAEDFGRIVAFLCSQSATFVTGAALNVDGGSYLGLQ